mmetsp:Transcript_12761/g.19273  ORF Transcript_12761/g.19273 Transcript_12761/m.19273 type:complete len:305 (+) Transcript_12761:44-958(+)
MNYDMDTYTAQPPQQTVAAFPSTGNAVNEDVLDWAMAIALDEYKRLHLLRTLTSASSSSSTLLSTHVHSSSVLNSTSSSTRRAPGSLLAHHANTNTATKQTVISPILYPPVSVNTTNVPNNRNNLIVFGPATSSCTLNSSNNTTFPYKLHMILSNTQHADVIHWAPHGKCFRIMKPKALEKILPLYFRHGKYSSFQRQLYIWGFQRVRSGPDRNAYFHESFRRGELEMCAKMDRKKEGSSSSNSQVSNNSKPNSRSGSPSLSKSSSSSSTVVAISPSSAPSKSKSGSVTPDVDGSKSPQRCADV